MVVMPAPSTPTGRRDRQSHIDALLWVHRGFDQLAALIAPTLGPVGGAVMQGSPRHRTEHLTDAGAIARRVTAFSEPRATVGAMMLRNAVLTMHERNGDGAATCAVVARAMLESAVRAVVAGAHPSLVRSGIEQAIATAIAALPAQAVPASGQETLTALAGGVTGDPELAPILGEMFDLLGPDAAFHIEETVTAGIDREYLDGGRWRARPAARDLMPPDGADLVLQRPLVFVAADGATRAADLIPVLEAAMSSSGHAPLLLVTGESVEGEALSTLVLNHLQGRLVLGAMVLAGAKPRVPDDLHDLALLTGATLIGARHGLPWHRVRLEHAGHARAATLDRARLVVSGGGGDRAAARVAVETLRARSAQPALPREERDRLRRRIARLAGGAGILKIGAASERERDARKERAERAIRVMTHALDDGLVPGGGMACLACLDAVLDLEPALATDDEAAGARAVAAGLEAPLAQLVRNRGLHHPPVVLARVRAHGPGHGYDVVSGTIVPLAANHLMDSLGVTRGALEIAASTVGTAITTATIVTGRRDRQRMGRKRS